MRLASHRTGREIPHVIAAALVILFSGCATTYREPAVEGMADDQLALLDLTGFDHDRYISPSVVEIDGKRVSLLTSRIFLKPGERNIKLRASIKGTKDFFYNWDDVEVETAFLAEAGKSYHPDSSLRIRDVEEIRASFEKKYAEEDKRRIQLSLDSEPDEDVARIVLASSDKRSDGPDILVNEEFIYRFLFPQHGFIWVDVNPGVVSIASGNQTSGDLGVVEIPVEASQSYFFSVISCSREGCPPPIQLEELNLNWNRFLGSFDRTGKLSRFSGRVTEIWGRSGMTVETDGGRIESVRIQRQRDGYTGYMSMEEAETLSRVLLGKNVTVGWKNREQGGVIRGEAFEAEGVDLSEFQSYLESGKTEPIE